MIPSASVDFVWSNAVLPYARRDGFLPFLREPRRIQRPAGIGSHRIPIKDVIGGKLNDLWFRERVWESSFMANSRFYTNRLRYLELLRLFSTSWIRARNSSQRTLENVAQTTSKNGQ